MIKNSLKQTGSAHVVIIVILAVAVLGLLGFVFWQNFIVKDDQSDTVKTQDSLQQEVEPSTKEFQSRDHNITFKYPADWSVVEDVSADNTSEWYATRVDILNSEGKIVATLSTGGQIGGACSDDAPLIPTFTTIKDSLEVQGIGATGFGYTVVENAADNYGIAFGLLEDAESHDNDLQLGNDLVRCPGMSINYHYIVTSGDPALGGIIFGSWYAEAQQDDLNARDSFTSLEDAKAYAQTDEFKQIEKTIKSLSIGK